MSKTSVDDETSADIADPLTRWQRVAAWALGLAAAGSGGYAVFASANQAGTALLLTIGIVFLLIGVQGTPIRRFGSNGTMVELARLKLAFRLEQQAEREPNTDIAKGLRKAAAAIVARPSTQWLHGSMDDDYRVRVLTALRDHSNLELAPGDRDAIATLANGDMAAIRTRFRMTDRASTDDLHRTRDELLLSRDPVPTVVITNVLVLDPALSQRFDGTREPAMEIVYWSGPADTESVVMAIERVAQARHTS